MAQFVEGSWNNFQFRMAQPSDYPQILAHLRQNFYQDEPLYFHSGYEAAMGDDADILVLDALRHNLSFVALDKKGKIAGVRITTIIRKEDHHNTLDNPNKPIHPKVAVIARLLDHLSEQGNIFTRLPEISHYADFFMVSVDREYRGCGLAKEIYERAFKMLHALGIPLIKCIFTSPITQGIARKRGFEEICQIKLNEWRDDRGQVCYPNAKNDECAILMIKRLN